VDVVVEVSSVIVDVAARLAVEVVVVEIVEDFKWHQLMYKHNVLWECTTVGRVVVSVTVPAVMPMHEQAELSLE
jgi:hypothetical protein